MNLFCVLLGETVVRNNMSFFASHKLIYYIFVVYILILGDLFFDEDLRWINKNNDKQWNAKLNFWTIHWQ